MNLDDEVRRLMRMLEPPSVDFPILELPPARDAAEQLLDAEAEAYVVLDRLMRQAGFQLITTMGGPRIVRPIVTGLAARVLVLDELRAACRQVEAAHYPAPVVFSGITVVEDPNLPPNVVEYRFSDGRVERVRLQMRDVEKEVLYGSTPAPGLGKKGLVS